MSEQVTGAEVQVRPRAQSDEHQHAIGEIVYEGSHSGYQHLPTWKVIQNITLHFR